MYDDGQKRVADVQPDRQRHGFRERKAWRRNRAQPSVLPLRPTLQQVIDELQSTQPGCVIDTDLQVDKPVLVDHVRIAQLLSNLLGNALTHGRRGAGLRESDGYGPAGDRGLQSGRSDLAGGHGAAVLAVRPRRGPSQPAGARLGLYISSEIARAHGGRIDVTSTPELTCFTFRMPVGRRCRPAEPS